MAATLRQAQFTSRTAGVRSAPRVAQARTYYWDDERSHVACSGGLLVQMMCTALAGLGAGSLTWWFITLVAGVPQASGVPC